MIRSAVCPLAHLTYEQQLEKKTREIEEILAQVRTGIAEEYKFLKGAVLPLEDGAKVSVPPGLGD